VSWEVTVRENPQQQPRHWFVTGASGGLGRRITEYALTAGDYVTAAVRRTNSLDDLKRTHGGRLQVEELDLSAPHRVSDLVTTVFRARPVDIVVNNAGYVLVGAAEEMSPEQIRDQIEVLLIAPILITREFLGPMRRNGGGHIFQISSMGGQVAVPTHSAYHAGKWGLEGFTESVAREVGDFGIRLTIVELGGTRTDFLSGMQFTEATEPYESTAVGQMRRAVRAADTSVLGADPHKVAAVIYGLSRQPDPPVRVTLGLDAHDAVGHALSERMSVLAAQRTLAASVRFDD